MRIAHAICATATLALAACTELYEYHHSQRISQAAVLRAKSESEFCEDAAKGTPGTAFELERRRTNCSRYGPAKAEWRRPAPYDGVFVGSRISGLDRLCLYNERGNEVTIVVGISDICPF